MPVRINQPIKQVSLMEDFSIFLNKYSTFTLADEYKERQEAEEAHQKQLLSELDDMIHSSNLIKWVHDSDGDRMNTDNLMEWLSLYYTIEPK